MNNDEVNERIAAAAAEGKPACDHDVYFDEQAARGLPAHVIVKRWPRGWFTQEKPCPKGCGYVGIYYASFVHYIAGDW